MKMRHLLEIQSLVFRFKKGIMVFLIKKIPIQLEKYLKIPI